MLVILLATITNSIIGHLNNPPQIDESKINVEMREQISCPHTLRVLSFNMLFDLCDHKQKPENRWASRKPRLVEYIEYAKPDLIGSQELQPNQIEDLMEALGDRYDYFGGERAIFYNKERLKFLCGYNQGRITVAEFEDCQGGSFTMINTHLTFFGIERRLTEAKQIAQIARSTEGPLIVTGDMNSFPMRPELDQPFYDGDYILEVIESGNLSDARKLTRRGHFGPICSTNFSPTKAECFCEVGEPGLILDHIFVNPKVKVKTHAIDPAQVDGHFISDHLPVLADLSVHTD